MSDALSSNMGQLEFALENIDGGTFEDLTMAYLRAEGYNVHESGRPGPDGGWDARVKLGERTGVAHVSSEQRWERKLRADAESVADLEKERDDDYDLFVFVTNQNVKGTQELDMEEEITDHYGWTLKLHHRKNIIGEIQQNSPEVAGEFLDIDLGTDHDLQRRIRELRDQRVEQIRNREGDCRGLIDGPAVALHLIPYGIYTHEPVRSATDVPDPVVLGDLFTTTVSTRGKHKIAFGRNRSFGHTPDEYASYGVLRNDGLYETVNREMIGVHPDTGEAWLTGHVQGSGPGLDASVVIATQRTLTGLREIGFSGSVLASLSLIDAAGTKLSTPRNYDRLYEPPALEPNLYSTMLHPVPIKREGTIEDVEPMLSEVWREFGHEEGTMNIENGTWTGGRMKIGGEMLLDEGDR